MTTLHRPALLTLAALFLCFVAAAIVGKARGAYAAVAPAAATWR